MKFLKQETGYSCGASALRNCILSLENIAKSEPYYRRLCKTNELGTNEKDIYKAALYLGYLVKSIQTKSEKTFRNKLKTNLINGGKSIVLIDGTQHWVAVVDYKDKYLTVIDSDFSKLKVFKTMSEFAKSAYNFDKHQNKYYYIIINIQKNEV